MEQFALNKLRLLQFLDEFQTESQDCISVYLTPDSLSQPVRIIASQLGIMPEEISKVLEDESVKRVAERRRSGLVLLRHAGQNGFIVLPPFNITEDRVSRGAADTITLRSLLEKERIIGMILVNWGSYAVGVFQGNILLSSKVGTGHIHPRHKKGGSSQKRFARRTEEQKKDFLKRVAGRIEQILQGYNLEYLFFGGNRFILKPLLNETAFLMSCASQVSPRLLKTTYSNQKSLLKSLEDAYESVCFRY